MITNITRCFAAFSLNRFVSELIVCVPRGSSIIGERWWNFKTVAFKCRRGWPSVEIEDDIVQLKCYTDFG